MPLICSESGREQVGFAEFSDKLSAAKARNLYQVGCAGWLWQARITSRLGPTVPRMTLSPCALPALAFLHWQNYGGYGGRGFSITLLDGAGYSGGGSSVGGPPPLAARPNAGLPLPQLPLGQKRLREGDGERSANAIRCHVLRKSMRCACTSNASKILLRLAQLALALTPPSVQSTSLSLWVRGTSSCARMRAPAT